MAKSSDLTPYRPTTISWSALKAIDADKPPMPNAGMQAIAAICGQASAMGANFHPAGLGNIVAGNNAVLMPPAHQISGMNGAALAAAGVGLGLAASGAFSSSESSKSKPKTGAKTDKPAASTTGATKTSPATSVPTTEKATLTPPPGGSTDVPEPPTKAAVDPMKYSGFEESDKFEPGKGTKIVLGGNYSPPKPVAKPAVAKPTTTIATTGTTAATTTTSTTGATSASTTGTAAPTPGTPTVSTSTTATTSTATSTATDAGSTDADSGVTDSSFND